MARRLGACQDPRRDRGRTLVQLAGAKAQPSRLELGGQLGGDRVEVLVVAELERLRDPPVEHATAGRRDLAVRDLADAVVAEVVLVEPVLPDDASPPQLVEAFDEVRLIQIG